MAVEGLAGANLIVGVLNLVPGLPLDGGRVLKAVVWGATGSMQRGTVVAAWAGRVAAIAGAGLAVGPGAPARHAADIFDFVLAAMIALFLWTAATAALASARPARGCPHLVARELARRALAVPDDLPLAEAVRRAREAEAGSLITVTGSGVPVGLVSEAALLATPEERRPWVAVSTVARAIEPGLRLPACDQRRGAGPRDVGAAGGGVPPRRGRRQIYGVLSTGDVERAFRAACRPSLTAPLARSRPCRPTTQTSRPRPGPGCTAVRCGRASGSGWSTPRAGATTSASRPGKRFFSNRGHLEHDELIGREEGFTVTSSAGGEYLVFRPLLSEFVVSMPRGAAVVYPKDAAQIVAMADIFPGAHVVEAGVGSGALTCSLLRAVGPHGRVLSFERREEFADVARAQRHPVLRGRPPGVGARLGDLAEALPASGERADRVILDMLAPWECLEAAAGALLPGGILCAYVATTTQLSRFVETVRVHGGFTEPQAWESLVRDWHVEGLAVRPGHSMIGHTAFLVTARRMAPGEAPPLKRRRPAPGAYGPDYAGPRPPGVPTRRAPTE